MSMGSRLKRLSGGVLPRLKGVVEVNASVSPLKRASFGTGSDEERGPN
jgi:hypothetical protein